MLDVQQPFTLMPTKLIFFIIATDSIVYNITKCIGFMSSALQSNLRNLGALFDQSVLLDYHVKSRIVSTVTQSQVDMLIHRIVSLYLT